MKSAFIIRSAPSKKDKIDFVLNENQIVIGWSKTEDKLLDKSNNREEFKKIISDSYSWYKEKPYSLGQAVGYLWRFIREMKVGDYVIVPIAKAFYIGEVKSEAKFHKDGIIDDIAIRRDVEWLNNKIPIQRYFCDSGLTSRLKYQGTCVGATDLLESIRNVLENVKNNKNVTFKQQVNDSLKENLVSILTSKSTYLDSNKFEELVRQLMQALGAKSRIPSKSKYGRNKADVDVIADFEHLGISIYVQVKYHTKVTNEFAVEQIIDAIKLDNSDIPQPILGWVVSTATFSQDAIRLAYQNSIRCIEVEELAEMMLSVGLDKFHDIYQSKNKE